MSHQRSKNDRKINPSRSTKARKAGAVAVAIQNPKPKPKSSMGLFAKVAIVGTAAAVASYILDGKPCPS